MRGMALLFYPVLALLVLGSSIDDVFSVMYLMGLEMLIKFLFFTVSVKHYGFPVSKPINFVVQKTTRCSILRRNIITHKIKSCQ